MGRWQPWRHVGTAAATGASRATRPASASEHARGDERVPGGADPAHVPGGEPRAFGRLHVQHVVVQEEHPPAGDRQARRHGVEDGGVGLDQAELEGEEAVGEGLRQ